jgi:UDP-N-acetylmuramoylalanine--D-glutamate ligase
MKKIAIWGFGVTGQSSLKYFLNTERYNESEIDIFDSGENKFTEEELNNFNENGRVKFNFETNEISDVENYSLILISPGISPKHPCIKKAYDLGIKVVNDVALFLEEWKNIGISVGVTGSNGKSTIANLIHGSLSAVGRESILVGNIGQSPLEYLSKYQKAEGIEENKPIAVMELSSFQLETFKEEHFVDIAVISNITPNHLDRHGNDIQEYSNAKMNIFNENETTLITTSDDEGIQKHILPFIGKTDIKNISLAEGEIDPVLQEFTDPDKRELKGMHNFYNIALALEVLKCLDVELPNENISNFIKKYKGLEHRIEFAREIDGVKFYNDSKSTSPDATRVALQALGENKNVVLIAGGTDKNVSFGSWLDPINLYVKKIVILNHDINQKLIDLAEKTKTPYEVVEDMENGIKKAKEAASSGEVVLLSPGAASFGKFNNFENRGTIFKEIVNSL